MSFSSLYFSAAKTPSSRFHLAWRSAALRNLARFFLALAAGLMLLAAGVPVQAAPEIDIQQPLDISIADGGSAHFGSPAVGASSALTFFIRNTGTAALSLSGAPAVAISGTNAAEFTVTAPPAASVAAGAVSITNSGFETPVQAANGFTYAPSGSGWTFGSAAGVARNGSPWFVNAAPEGVQAGFIQRTAAGGAAGSSLSRVFSFPNTGSYVIRFSTVRRNASFPANDIAVQMDGATLRTIANTEQPDDVWRTFLVPYQCTVAGNHTLAFLGMRTGGDYASAIDAVQIVGATTFEVTFSPAATGARTASLSIANNDSNENPYDITLTGSPGLGTVYTVTTGTGQAIVPGTADIGNHCHDCMTTLSLPFTFNFYGSPFTSANVGSNGTLQFSSKNFDGENLPLPYGGLNHAILPYWDDLTTVLTQEGHGIFTSVSGSAPNRVFNIEWRAKLTTNIVAANFEIRLYETTGRIDFVYNSSPPFTGTSGLQATIGLQRGTGGAGGQFNASQFSHNGSVSDGLRVTFTPTEMPGAPTPTPSPCATFANPANIQIPQSGTAGPAAPYPSNIAVSGLGGTVTRVTVKLKNLASAFPDDIDMLLVGPGGQNAVIMSDVGGDRAVFGSDGVVLTLDDETASSMPDQASLLLTGTFKPTNIGAGDSFPAPAPAPAGGSELSVFNGTSPNGAWSLYVSDDASPNGSAFTGGWELSITTTSCAPPPLSGTKTVGAGGDYPNLTGANGLFADINGSTVAGNIIASIIGDLSEDGAHALNQWLESGAGNYTLTVQPDAANTRTISGAVANGGMIRLNGADRVAMDGRFGGTGRFLTFRNTDPANPTIALLNDASNNTIRSSIIEGATTTASNGVVTFGAGATTGNDNNLVTDNQVRDLSTMAGVPTHLILSLGSSASVANSNNTISNNEIFNFTSHGIEISLPNAGNESWTLSGNTIYQTAARTAGMDGILFNSSGTNQITGNTIRDLNTSDFTNGIVLQSGTNITVSRNRIYSFPSTAGSTGTLRGIFNLGATSLTVVNNQVTIIPAFTNTQPIEGIRTQAGLGTTFDAYYNTVLIGGASSGTNPTWAFARANVSTTTLRNNVFFNNRTRASGTANHFAAGRREFTGGVFSSDYNLFAGTGATAADKFMDLGDNSIFFTFANWQAGTGGDANSNANTASAYSAGNLFVDAANGDLHIKSFFSPLLNAGTPLGAVTTDFDTEPRSPSRPDIGADEISCLQEFRLQYFNTIANNGDAANLFDFDQDGLVNIVEYAFDLNPKLGSSLQLPQAQIGGGNLFYSFTEPAGVCCITYGAEWSATMQPNDWHAITDTGIAPQHIFSVPIVGQPKLFIRLSISAVPSE